MSSTESDNPEDQTLARTGLHAKDLMIQFESLGDNCEFGLVQRHYGAEPVGVFRFSNPKADMILRGLQRNFSDLGSEVKVELDQQKPRREWIIIDPIYRTRQHTFMHEGDPKEAALQSNMRRYIDFLKRKLLDDIDNANKIYVIKSVPNIPTFVVHALASELRQRGPNWLLWVTDGQPNRQVQVLKEGLMTGRVQRLMPENDPEWGRFHYQDWLEVLTQAWVLSGRRLA